MTNGFDDDLFGSDLFTGDGDVFDPLEAIAGEPPEPREDHGQTPRESRLGPSGDIPAGTIGSISYDRGDNEIIGAPTRLEREDGLRPRVDTLAERRYARDRAVREATSTGNRNAGRAAAVDTGVVGEGATGGNATTIREAGNALRSTLSTSANEREVFSPTPEPIPDSQHGSRTTLPPGELDDRVRNFILLSAEGRDTRLAGGRAFTMGRHTTVSEAPGLQSVEFSCEVYGVKLSNAGDWMLTVKIPNHYGEVLTALSRAVGLNLRTTMVSEGMA